MLLDGLNRKLENFNNFLFFYIIYCMKVKYIEMYFVIIEIFDINENVIIY